MHVSSRPLLVPDGNQLVVVTTSHVNNNVNKQCGCHAAAHLPILACIMRSNLIPATGGTNGSQRTIGRACTLGRLECLDPAAGRTLLQLHLRAWRRRRAVSTAWPQRSSIAANAAALEVQARCSTATTLHIGGERDCRGSERAFNCRGPGAGRAGPDSIFRKGWGP
jgi:hypothetical protein